MLVSKPYWNKARLDQVCYTMYLRSSSSLSNARSACYVPPRCTCLPPPFPELCTTSLPQSWARTCAAHAARALLALKADIWLSCPATSSHRQALAWARGRCGGIAGKACVSWSCGRFITVAHGHRRSRCTASTSLGSLSLGSCSRSRRGPPVERTITGKTYLE